MVHHKEKLIRYLDKRSKPISVLAGLALILLITFIDFSTQDFFVLEFYIIPVVLAAWFAGRNAGFFMSFAGATATLALDMIESPYHAGILIHYLNFFMNFGFFLVVVYFVSVLKETLEIKSKFTSMVSHELRTPLGVIKESIYMVQDGLCGDVNDKQKHMLTITLRHVNRLARFINDILDFQKMESGKMPLSMEENDINQVVREAYRGIELLGKEKGLDFVFTIDKNLPKIKCDKDKIIQVLINLIGNAIKFTEKGTITIGTANQGTDIRVTVRDTGCGIKPVYMRKLFMSFEQSGDSNKHGREGTGLGLFISREIIVRHGGKIWAESEFGKGAMFHFTLPL